MEEQVSGYTDTHGFHRLEVIYCDPLGEIDVNFTQQLVASIVEDNAQLLTTLFAQTELVKSWQVNLADDGLGLDSPSQFNLLEFAKRKRAMDCASKLVDLWLSEQKVDEIMEVLHPTFAALEASFERGSACEESMEFIKACNAGAFRRSVAMERPDVFTHPLYMLNFPEAIRFTINDYSNFKGVSKKFNILVNKRVALRQRALKAVANGDANDLGHTLEAMRSNAIATMSKKEVHCPVFNTEVEILISMAIACHHLSCVDTVIQKYLSFDQSTEKFSKLEIINECIDILESRCQSMNEPPLESLGVILKKYLCKVIEEIPDGLLFIPELRDQYERNTPMLRDVLLNACDTVKARIESKMIMAVAKQPNAVAIAMPSKQVRL